MMNKRKLRLLPPEAALLLLLAFTATSCSDTADGGSPPSIDTVEGGGGRRALPDEEALGGGGVEDNAWRPSSDIRLDCSWLAQVPPGDWDHTLNCGPASLLMASSCIVDSPSSPAQQDIVDVITWMDENIDSYDGVATNDNGSYTNTAMLTLVANDYFGLEAQRLNGGTLEDLYDRLAEGRPVIVATYTQGTNNDPSDVMVGGGAAHFALLVGMSATHVFLNDPGRSAPENGEDRDYTIESFLTQWQGHAGVVFGPASP